MIHTFIRTAAFILLACIIGCSSGCGDIASTGDRIGIYYGTGAQTASATAIKLCLEAAGRDQVDLLTEAEIQSSLDDYRLLIIGGGDPIEILDALGYTGRERVKSMVSSGGSYIGIGAGAYLSGDSMVVNNFGQSAEPFGFFRGTASGPIPGLPVPPNYYMTSVDLTDSVLEPTGILSLSLLYYGGPSFSIIDPPDAVSIGTLTGLSLSAGLRFEYNFGRVLVTNVHPEFEENDSTDGTSFASDQDDPESDWFWLQAMVEWVLREHL